mmetsp:Transcript_7330/g.16064  ORF Transcript_7330/g.16064 Transcript_7330/m.16064 type:complete len:243 (-) Transcript_7330:181-909(-)
MIARVHRSFIPWASPILYGVVNRVNSSELCARMNSLRNSTIAQYKRKETNSGEESYHVPFALVVIPSDAQYPRATTKDKTVINNRFIIIIINAIGNDIWVIVIRAKNPNDPKVYYQSSKKAYRDNGNGRDCEVDEANNSGSKKVKQRHHSTDRIAMDDQDGYCSSCSLISQSTTLVAFTSSSLYSSSLILNPSHSRRNQCESLSALNRLSKKLLSRDTATVFMGMMENQASGIIARMERKPT